VRSPQGALRGALRGKPVREACGGNPGEWGAVVVADLRATKDLMN